MSNTIVSEPIRLQGAAARLAGQSPYCADPYAYKRRKTRVVMVGNVGVGGDNPLRIQSMTTTLTKDVEATYAQTMKLIEVGCEIVRITTPTGADARALGEVKKRLLAQGVLTPLVADIHFSPNAAMEAALYADKVRINPGNFADAKLFKILEYSDDQYASELERIEEKFAPVVLRCKERGVAMRIGTNHGSLSDRIMNRYGDTPQGMVESALEFVSICEKYGYYDIILSMKASNPKVMIQAYRLLSARMAELGMEYPFHLGVTEAGNGEDGRIKSAIGIGSLLEDGIGDTIRVSLTEDPEFEIPVAYDLAERYTPRQGHTPAPLYPVGAYLSDANRPPDLRDPFAYEPRWTHAIQLGDVKLGANLPAQVVNPLHGPLEPDPLSRVLSLAQKSGPLGVRADILSVAADEPQAETLGRVYNEMREVNRVFPMIATTNSPASVAASADAIQIVVGLGEQWSEQLAAAQAAGAGANGKSLWLRVRDERSAEEQLADQAEHLFGAARQLYAMAAEARAAGLREVVLSLEIAEPGYRLRSYRLLDSLLKAEGIDYPLHLVALDVDTADESSLLHNAVALGALLTDGIGSSVELWAPDRSEPGPQQDRSRRLLYAFNVLQAAGARLTKTEFVACPSCGRTLFDLQTTTERIKARTGHLVGVKIAVMGCIVNGLGELADADFGYMGGAPDRVNLFVGKECIEKNVPTEIAVDKLIDLIKSHGRWVEPPVAEGH